MYFALFNLVGRLLSARIHDLGKIVPHRISPKRDYTGTYPAASSFTFGHATTSLPSG